MLPRTILPIALIGVAQIALAGSHDSFPALKGDVGKESEPANRARLSDTPHEPGRRAGSGLLRIHIDDDGILILDALGFPVPVPFDIGTRPLGARHASQGDSDQVEGKPWKLSTRDIWKKSRRRREEYYPRTVRGMARFQFPDRGYEAVYIAGSFNDWNLRPMELDREREVWDARIDLDRGTHRYVFVLEDSLGQRRRPDPSNPTRVRQDDQGWVSEILIGKDGRVVGPYDESDFAPVGSVSIVYQRVDGLGIFIHPYFVSRRPYYPAIHTKLGYGFKGKRWILWGRFDQPVTSGDEVTLWLAGYRMTDFTDQTGVSTTENTLSALTTRWDYRDYFERTGLTIGVTFDLPLDAEVTTEYRVDDYESLETTTSASLGINGPSEFRPNPAVDEGTMRSILTTATVGSELNRLVVAHEYSGGSVLEGDFFFSRLTARFRTRLRLGRQQWIDLRLAGGSNLAGELPRQKRYQVGGVGTVRGYGYQSRVRLDPGRDPGAPAPYGGETLGLANAEYVFAVARHIQTVLFFDSGTTWESRSQEMSLGDFSSSLGVGFQTADDELRLSLAKSLGAESGGVVAYLRLNRMF